MDFTSDFDYNETDVMFDLFIDQLHQFAEMVEDDGVFATTSSGSVAQLDRATAF